jgi:ABC-2 type transport system permease protein
LRNAQFFKECKQIIKSIPFFICVAVLLLFFIAQYEPDFVKIEKPQPGKSNYGTKISDNPKIIEPSAVKSLYSESVRNSYTAYPIGFYKNVKLNASQQREMARILSELTGNPENKFLSAMKNISSGLTVNGGNMTKNEDGSYSIGKSTEGKTAESTNSSISMVKSDMTVEQFHALMRQADQLIGGGSLYGSTYLSRFGVVPKTYEDALKDYNDIVTRDGITGAYARTFCDYLGIVLALFPVFLAVAAGMKDRRTGMRELVYSRKISSTKIVLTRYIALLAILFLPVLLLAVYATIQTVGEYPGFELHLSAFIGYSFGWLLPTLMVSTAVGMVITELTDTPVGIVVQGLWWFFGLFAGIWHIDGGYGWDLILRHNTVGNTQVYLDNFFILLWNRVGYSIFALILISVTIWVYERKRRGKWNAHLGFRKNSNHRHIKSAA